MIGRLERLITTEELAAYLSVPRSTLYAWRYRGEGPPAIRVGRYLRYRMTEVEGWLDLRSDDVFRKSNGLP